ncbi:cytochrome P450 2C30-like isoform X2 [Clavelina lepadiformis]|uniref:cytochrome P450 2C30-like isoform X2 n=1 Tax=Clavelina lepadiformis TaxID=159417 RepID=UPI004040F4EF
MFDFTIAALFVVTFVGVYYWYRRPNKFPPGPRGIPFLGVIPLFGKWPERQCNEWKKKYGPIFSVRALGRQKWIVLNDFESINECLVKQSNKFSGRPFFEALQTLIHGKGLSFLDYGPLWKSQRKFGQKIIRGIGLERKGVDSCVNDEVPFLLESLRATDGKAFDILSILPKSSCNVLCSVFMGKRYEYDDDTLCTLVRLFSDVFHSSFDNFSLQLFIFAPKLMYIYPFSQSYKKLKKLFEDYAEILNRVIAEHEETFDKEHPRDFIDAFLKNMKEGSDKNFHIEQLHMYIRDIFEGGIETTTNTLNWSLICLLHYPEIQTKLREEIREIVGQSGSVKMSHKDDMPYTNAFIEENLRFLTSAPLGFQHKTNQDAEINGYIIPKGTTVTPNIWAVQNDPKYFDEPEKFKPERFIDEKGNFIKSEHVIPFSVGARRCMGEHLARMEVFIFLVSMIQRFEILPDPESKIPVLNDGINGPTFVPYSYKLIFQEI